MPPRSLRSPALISHDVLIVLVSLKMYLKKRNGVSVLLTCGVTASGFA